MYSSSPGGEAWLSPTPESALFAADLTGLGPLPVLSGTRGILKPRRPAAGRAQPAPVSSKEAAPTKAATTAMDTVRPCWPSCIGRQADTARTIPPRASIYICASGADIWRPIGQEQVRRTADQVAPDSPSCSESRPVDEVRCAPRQFGDLMWVIVDGADDVPVVQRHGRRVTSHQQHSGLLSAQVTTGTLASVARCHQALGQGPGRRLQDIDHPRCHRAAGESVAQGGACRAPPHPSTQPQPLLCRRH